jgi:hypothetical protein
MLELKNHIKEEVRNILKEEDYSMKSRQLANDKADDAVIHLKASYRALMDAFHRLPKEDYRLNPKGLKIAIAIEKLQQQINKLFGL